MQNPSPVDQPARRLARYLVPLDRSDPSWAASTVRTGLWYGGQSESAARRRTAEATALAVPHRPGSLALGSPWLHARLASCELRECPFELRPGVVVDENGEPVDPAGVAA
jgi:hypothetical protein